MYRMKPVLELNIIHNYNSNSLAAILLINKPKAPGNSKKILYPCYNTTRSIHPNLTNDKFKLHTWIVDPNCRP